MFWKEYASLGQVSEIRLSPGEEAGRLEVEAGKEWHPDLPDRNWDCSWGCLLGAAEVSPALRAASAVHTVSVVAMHIALVAAMHGRRVSTQTAVEER
mmetsp:Transcript_23071/g.46688  ORF Transcript_23071/g.46688 Transcript_23071/m.46688 type:complete len:97 (+) Transcript_23071:469-759(+)